jgi:hypothetical protein
MNFLINDIDQRNIVELPSSYYYHMDQTIDIYDDTFNQQWI